MKVIINFVNGSYTFSKWTPPCTKNKAGEPIEPQERYMSPTAIVTEISDTAYKQWEDVRSLEDVLQNDLRKEYIKKWSNGAWDGYTVINPKAIANIKI